MSINKLLIIVLVIISAKVVFTQSQKYEKGFLWEISGNGLEEPSYLFGTIHSSMEIFFELSDSVLLAIESTECFAGEVNLDSLQHFIVSVASNNKEYPDISEILSEEECEKLNEILEEKLGLSLEFFLSENPAMIAFALERDQFKGNMPYFLDEYLYKIAKIRGKTIQGIENYDDQLNLFESLSVDELRELLLAKLEEDDDEERIVSELIESFREQDLNKLASIIQREFNNEDTKQKLLINRNFKMIERIELLIKKSSAFIAVGVAHLIDENGLIELLKQKGYTLRAVQVANTGLYQKYIDEIIGQPWIVYSPPSGGFSIEMPGEGTPYPMPSDVPGVKVETGLYVEVGSQTVYMVMKVIYPINIEEQRKDSVFNSIINNLRLNKYQIKEEIKDIIYDGLRGKEFIAVLGPNTSLSKLFIRDNNLIYLQIILPEGKMDSKNTDRFFNSFKLLDEKKPVHRASGKFISEMGAFKINFDYEPYYQFINNYNIPVYVYTSTDKMKKSSNMVMYSDDNRGYYDNDSSEIRYKIGNTASALNGKLVYFVRSEMEFPCFNFKIFYDDGIFLGRALLRGRRTYIISSTCYPENYDSVETEKFLNSFELIDYQPITWREYKDENNSFTVNLPESPSINSDTSYYSIKYTQEYVSVDSISGTAYKFYKYSLSEYYQAENDSALFSLFPPIYFDSNEVYVETDTLIGKIKMREWIIKPVSTVNYTRSRVLINGNSVYNFEVTAPGNLIFGERVSPYFDSIKILEENSHDVYSDKTEIFFKDLESKDSVKSHNASHYCASFNFNENHTEKIYSILRKKFYDDSEETGVRASLLNSLRSIETSSKLDFIMELYPGLSGNSILQLAALEVVSGINSVKSTQLFLDLILSDTPQIDTYKYLLFSPFYDSLKNLSILFPRILELMKYDEYKPNIYSLLGFGIDSMAIQPEQYFDYEQVIVEDSQRFVSIQDSVASKALEDDYNWEIIDILKTFPAFKNNPEVVEILLNLSVDSEIDVVFQAVLSSLKLGIETDFDTYLRIAEDIKWRNNFYNELIKISKTNLFPEEYLSQNYFAESDLYNWLYDEYSEPDTIILIDTLKNEEGTFYLYKFNLDYDPENFYIGISGPQPGDEDLVTTSGHITRSAYSRLDDKSVEEHWAELLKPESYK